MFNICSGFYCWIFLSVALYQSCRLCLICLKITLKPSTKKPQIQMNQRRFEWSLGGPLSKMAVVTQNIFFLSTNYSFIVSQNYFDLKLLLHCRRMSSSTYLPSFFFWGTFLSTDLCRLCKFHSVGLFRKSHNNLLLRNRLSKWNQIGY